MSNEKDILIMMYQEEWQQIRHVELQRSTITNLILIVTAVILGFVPFKDLTISHLPITLFLCLIGLFGALFSAKLHERASFQIERARRYRDRLEEIFPDTKLKNIREIADQKHVKNYPRLDKVRINKLWILFHLIVSFSGLILTIFVILKMV